MSDWRTEPPSWQSGPPQQGPAGYQPYQQGVPYGTPPAGPWPYRPPRASFVQRLGGLIVDGLVATLAMMALLIPLVILGVVLSATEEQLCTNSRTGLETTCSVPTGGTVVLWLLLFLVAIVGYLAIIFFLLVRPVAKTGQTIGRRLVGIRVVDQDTGQLISLGRALGRYIFASFISGFFYIGYLWMLWDDNAQTLHDKVVRAVVVPADR